MKSKESPLIPADDAARMIGQAGVVWVDARGGPDAFHRYMSGHVPGAVFMDLEKDLSAPVSDPSKGGRHPLPTPDAFAKVLGRVGITPQSRIIVYDDKGGANAAARFWWMVKAVGHDKIHVLDGGWAALSAIKIPVSKETPTSLPSATYTAAEWSLLRADIECVDRVRLNSDYRVVDVRENYRYEGESEPIDLIAGHIPGAINLPYTENLEKNNTFKPPEILADKFHKVLGDCDMQKVIVHCGSGVTACHTILAMAHAGIQLPQLYVGSWSEWSRNPKPMATKRNP